MEQVAPASEKSTSVVHRRSKQILTHETKHIYEGRKRRYHETVPSSVRLVNQRIDCIGCEQRNCHVWYVAERQLVISGSKPIQCHLNINYTTEPRTLEFSSHHHSEHVCLVGKRRHQGVGPESSTKIHTSDVKLVGKKGSRWSRDDLDIHSFRDLFKRRLEIWYKNSCHQIPSTLRSQHPYRSLIESSNLCSHCCR